tara:strand:- start:239 stop:553 length:315 start_codon:yes stop_codon:yes gene_type:complete
MTIEDSMNFTQDYGPLIAGIAIFIAVVVVIKKSWPTISQIVEIVNTISELPETIEKLHLEIKEIRKEVLPNGGTSLRDAVNRTENQLKKVAFLVAKHEKEISQD